MAFQLTPARRHRLSTGGSERIQLSALLGATKIAVQLSEKDAAKK
jgi:hypothetical protein